MKRLLIGLACSLLVGCEYTVPLVTTPAIEIDRSVLGLWERSKDDGQTEQLVVLELDKHEYLVSYPSDSIDAMFARACRCRIGDQILIQLKWLGTAQAKHPEDNRLFQYATYSIAGDKLTVRLLNSELVNKDIAATEELAKAITANHDKSNLFKDGMIFTKVNK